MCFDLLAKKHNPMAEPYLSFWTNPAFWGAFGMNLSF